MTDLQTAVQTLIAPPAGAPSAAGNGTAPRSTKPHVQAASTPSTASASAPSTSDADRAELARLRAENAALWAARTVQASARLSLKVSAKGALSVYGLGRFPVTLYREQWERLLGHAPAIADFIREHESTLSVKGHTDQGHTDQE